MGDNKSKGTGEGRTQACLRRVSPQVSAVQGAGAWLDHPRRPRCQAGRLGISLCAEGPLLLPNSSHTNIGSLVAQDLYKV